MHKAVYLCILYTTALVVFIYSTTKYGFCASFCPIYSPILVFLFLIIVYFLLKVIHETGYFTVTLDTDMEYESALVMYEKLAEKKEKKVLI